jgi:type I restriction-modification system DNA methylase subunit
MLDAQTKSRIDSARDILVGKVPDPKSQVEQITIALIYKFMDDMDRQSEELGGKATFFTGDFKKYRWANLLDKRLGGHERLLLYAEGIEKMNENKNIPQLFRDIFKGVFLPYRDPETLNLFLKEINGFSYDHSERLGDAFEYLLSVLGTQGDAGQFRTPRHVIDFIVAVVDPKKHETVLDPACGTAGFLISAFKHILKNNENLTPDERARLMTNFRGYDIAPDMVRLSRANLYLHGFPNPVIHEYDTLTSEERWDERCDVILANPPFMSPKGGIRPHNRFSIKAKRSEVLFVDYMAEHLNPGGRAGIIVPEGIIFQSAGAYRNLRKMLIANGLYAVVSLPIGVFNPYATAKTSILFIDKVFGRCSKDILFIKIASDGFDLGAQRRPIEANDLPTALNVLRQFQAYTLRTTAPISVSLAKDIITASKDCSLLADHYATRGNGGNNRKSKTVKLSKILTESKTRVGSVPNLNARKVDILSMTMKGGLVRQDEKFKKRIASKDISAYKLVKRGQLVIGFPIDEGVLSVSQEYEYGAVSPAYAVWDVDYSGFDMRFFDLFIKCRAAVESYKKLMVGTANRRRNIPKEVFLSIEIPIPSESIQKLVVDELGEIEKAKKLLDASIQRISTHLAEAWDE